MNTTELGPEPKPEPLKPQPSAPAQPPPFELTIKLHSKDAALERVQKTADDEKAARKEERFYWICGVVFLFDIFLFKDMQTWTAPLVIGVLQFFVLIALGRALGVDHIWTITERLIEKWDGSFGGGKSKADKNKDDP